MNIPQELIGEVEACVARRGATVVDLLVRGAWKNRVYEIFVDNEDGVTLDLCAELSREILPLLTRLHVPEVQYRLTVSSPGIDRPLKHPWQFKKHVGRVLEVKQHSGAGIQSTTGRLASLDEKGLVLCVELGNEERHVDFHEIMVARVRAPW